MSRDVKEEKGETVGRSVKEDKEGPLENKFPITVKIPSELLSGTMGKAVKEDMEKGLGGGQEVSRGTVSEVNE